MEIKEETIASLCKIIADMNEELRELRAWKEKQINHTPLKKELEFSALPDGLKKHLNP